MGDESQGLEELGRPAKTPTLQEALRWDEALMDR